jgi:hypothetical protein
MGAVHAELFRQAWCNRQNNTMTEPDGLRLLEITLASRPNDYRPSRLPVSLLVSAREQAVTC